MDAAVVQLTDAQLPLEKIGQGFCGTVWTSPRRGVHHEYCLVLKREDGGPGRSIVHEHLIHGHLLAALKKEQANNAGAKLPVNIPFCEGLLGKDSLAWSRIMPRLPSGFESCNALVNERIPPMPDPVGNLLFCTYHPEGVSTAADRNCLIRPYLGRRRHRPQATAARMRPGRLLVFSLRNYPLHIDQIEELGLPATKYAIAMADSLAFLHWTAKLDANDIEFVLAPARPAASTRSTQGTEDIDRFDSKAFGVHTMWMLDFDCCRKMSMDESGVNQAARSFLRNDPFYPRPGSSNPADAQLWATFHSRFLETSYSILKGEGEQIQRLPAMLMDKIVQNSCDA